MNSTDSAAPIPVHRIAIPNPFFEGSTNAYLLDAEPLTLIDTGIGTDEAFTALSRGFERAGRRVESLQRIILTHKHQDHFGLARRLQDLTGCEVFVHEDDWRDVAEVSERLGEYVEILCRRLSSWGAPAAEVENLVRMPHMLDQLAGSTDAQQLTDGQRLPCGAAEIEVIHTPGHTIGSICLQMDDALFTGDHVLPGYTPNIGGADVEYDGLLAKYLASLKRIATFDRPGLMVWPGHDEPVLDLTAQVRQTLAHHEQRENDILQLLRDGRPMTVFEIAVTMFGTMRDYHLVLGTGEVHAHLELLIEKQLVAEDEGRYRQK